MYSIVTALYIPPAVQKSSSFSTSSPILHKHYNKYACIIVLHMHAKIFLKYIYPEMTESETNLFSLKSAGKLSRIFSVYTISSYPCQTDMYHSF